MGQEWLEREARGMRSRWQKRAPHMRLVCVVRLPVAS